MNALDKRHTEAMDIVSQAFVARTLHLQRMISATEELLERIDEALPGISAGDPDYVAIAAAMRECDEIINARFTLAVSKL